jgi:PAP2 superfamily
LTAAVQTIGRRYLPRGWSHFGRQLAIWFGFLTAYQIARGIAGRNPTAAFENGLRVVGWEERVGDLFELSLQHVAATSGVLMAAVSWTYWMSEFAVIGVALLWVYLRRHDRFYAFRNWILLANVIGLIGYVALPTAPPRMYWNFGFVDWTFGGLNHGSGFVQFAANQYAAMPSLHAGDALIVGVSLAMIVKNRWLKGLWLLWPAWVCFSVMATANHFWLDCVAGMGVALLAAAILQRRRIWRFAAA